MRSFRSPGTAGSRRRARRGSSAAATAFSGACRGRSTFPRHRYRVEAGRASWRSAVPAASGGASRYSSPGRRRDRGARRRQRDQADQPHPQARVPGRAAARRRGVHALPATGRATRRTSTTRTGRRRGRARGDLLLQHRRARGVRRPAALQPEPRPRRHGHRSRRRPDARPLGYHTTCAAHGYDLYYLNALAGDRRSMAAADDPELAWIAPRGQDMEKDPAFRSSVIRVANAPVSYGAFELTVGVLPNIPGPDRVLDAIAASATRAPSSGRSAISAGATCCATGSRRGPRAGRRLRRAALRRR